MPRITSVATSIAMRMVLVSGALAASAQAQEMVTFQWSFAEVMGGTTNPVANPDGVIGPGEGAELRMDISFTPAVGTVVSIPPPPASSGIVSGFGAAFFDLEGDPNASGFFNAMRTWGSAAHGPPPGQTGLQAVQFGQLALPGEPVDPANPIENAFRIVWTPHDYATRHVMFTASRALAAPSGSTGASLCVNIAQNPGEYAWYVKPVAADFGSLQIPIVPAPSSLAIVALAALAAVRRSR